GSDVLDGGGGRDWVGYFLARGDVRANLSTHRASGEGLDTLVHVEDLEGSPYDDVLVGNADRNQIDGGNGSDALLGSDGADRLLGGRGDDTLRGGAGADVLDDSLRVAQGVFPDTGVDLLAGGPGDDRLRGGDEVRANDTLHGGTGDDACSADRGGLSAGCRPEDGKVRRDRTCRASVAPAVGRPLLLRARLLVHVGVHEEDRPLGDRERGRRAVTLDP